MGKKKPPGVRRVERTPSWPIRAGARSGNKYEVEDVELGRRWVQRISPVVSVRFLSDIAEV
jgi:hypothetical protein